MIPFTSPHGFLLVNGVPVALVSDLGIHGAAVRGLEAEHARTGWVGEHQPAGRHGQRLALRRARS